MIPNSRFVDPQGPFGRFTPCNLLLAVSRCYLALLSAKTKDSAGERRPVGCFPGVLSAISAVRLNKRSSSRHEPGICSPGFVFYAMSSTRSRIVALRVIQPEEIRSTPVAATAGAVSRLIRPEASVMARPPTVPSAPAHRFRHHVLEQHGVDADHQRFGELVEGIDFELDLDEMPGMLPPVPMPAGRHPPMRRGFP